jgi:hypothetical protein
LAHRVTVNYSCAPLEIFLSRYQTSVKIDQADHGNDALQEQLLEHWQELTDLPENFLAINITNNSDTRFQQNTGFRQEMKTGYWVLPKATFDPNIIGQHVYLYFCDPTSKLRDILRGVVTQADRYPQGDGKRDRYVLHVAKPGWKKVGCSAKTFSQFFEGQRIGSSPVTAWMDGNIYLPPQSRQPTSGPSTSHAAQDRRETEIEKDVEALLASVAKGTDVLRLVQARIGQGSFRRDVLKMWGHACAVTGITELAVLRSSHIKPWRIATDAERLSPENGLPLIANLDALFDRGLISFDVSGHMHCSPELAQSDRKALGLPISLRKPPSSETLHFLQDHWEAFGYENMETPPSEQVKQ